MTDERHPFKASTVFGAVFYQDCRHRFVRGWWHRVRGQHGHVITVLGTDPVEGDTVTIRYRADGTFTLPVEEGHD